MPGSQLDPHSDTAGKNAPTDQQPTTSGPEQRLALRGLSKRPTKSPLVLTVARGIPV